MLGITNEPLCVRGVVASDQLSTKESMKRFLASSIVALSMLMLLGCATVAPPALPIVGSWKLVSIESVFADGEITTEWMGPHPTGTIQYLPDGNMSVQFMSDPRPRFSESAGASREAFEKEAAAAYNGYYAYWGTYQFNPSSGEIRHHVAGSLRPAEVGRTLIRTVQLEEGKLVITTPVSKRRGKDYRNRLTFERMGPQ